MPVRRPVRKCIRVSQTVVRNHRIDLPCRKCRSGLGHRQNGDHSSNQNKRSTHRSPPQAEMIVGRGRASQPLAPGKPLDEGALNAEGISRSRPCPGHLIQTTASPFAPHPRHRNCPRGREPWPQGSVGPFSQNLRPNLSSQAPKIVTISSFDTSRAIWPSPISWCTRREVSSRCSAAGSWRSSTVSYFSIFAWPGAAHGASIECERPRPPYRRAAPEQQHHIPGRRLGRASRSTNLQLLAPRDRHQPQADHSEPPRREAVTLRRGLSPLPRSGALGPLFVDSKSPAAAVSRRPKP